MNLKLGWNKKIFVFVIMLVFFVYLSDRNEIKKEIMTTIEKIKSEINLTKIKKEDKKRSFIYEDSTDSEIIELEVYSKLIEKICNELKS